MNTPVLIANVVGWPVIHIGIARATLNIPLRRFSSGRLVAPGRFARHEMCFYRRWLWIQRWKSSLPDGAPWLGGFTKKRLAQRDRQYLFLFLLETRRAEFAHWCMLCCLPIFFLWNPPWACGVMTAYAIAANLPCILAQRYNRLVLASLLHRMDRRDAMRYKPCHCKPEEMHPARHTHG